MIRALAALIACLGCTVADAAERAPVVDQCGNVAWACGDPYVPDLVNGLRDMGAEAIYAKYGGGVSGYRSYAVAVVRNRIAGWRAWLILDTNLAAYQSRSPDDPDTRGTPAEYVEELERIVRPLPAGLGRRLRKVWAAGLARVPGGYADSNGLDGFSTTFATANYSVSSWDYPNELVAKLAGIADSLAIFVRTKSDRTATKRLNEIERAVDEIEVQLKSQVP